MLLGLSVYDLLIPTILLLNIILVIFRNEIDSSITSLFSINLPLSLLIIASSPVIVLGYLIFSVGILNALYSIFLILIAGYIFLVGFCANRKYIYGLGILLLITSFTLYIIGFTAASSYTIVLFYLSMILGILKDLFYAQIFEN